MDRCGSTTTTWGSGRSCGTGSSARTGSPPRSCRTRRARRRGAATTGRSPRRGAAPPPAAGGVAVDGEIRRGPVRMALLYRWAQRHTARPVKACIGAGPVQLSTLAHFRAGPVKDRYQLSRALADVFRAEVAEVVEAGCKHIQLEDLGAWMPHLSGLKDYDWVCEIVERTLGETPPGVERSWHFCKGNAWGNKLDGMTRSEEHTSELQS